MRLFIAVEVPEPWRDAARAQREALERVVRAPLRWVDPALLHLTLRFLGEVAEAEVAGLQAALTEHVPPVDVALHLEAPGTFGGPTRGAIVWLGVGGDRDALDALVGRVETAVHAAGLPAEGRAYRAHLTLARVGRQASRIEHRAVASAVERVSAPPPSPFRARSVALVRSHLGGAAPRYEVLSRHG